MCLIESSSFFYVPRSDRIYALFCLLKKKKEGILCIQRVTIVPVFIVFLLHLFKQYVSLPITAHFAEFK